jgi:hypothetical protein
MRNLAIVIGLAVSAAMFSGCAPGSGEGLDENGRPIGESGSMVPLTAEFGSIQQNVFTPTCAIPGCHIGAAAPEGLRLDEASSFASLVGVASTQFPGLLRVQPNNAQLSYLIQKLEGTALVGGRMPLSGPPFLPQTTIDVIRQWITDGALPAQGPALAPIVVSVVPADGSAFDMLPTEITVIFSDDMDASLVNATTVQLLGSGGDGSFADGNELVLNPASIGLSPSNPRLLSIDLTGVSSNPDDYQLRLAGSGATALASVAGLILDGDADGSAGGDFTSIITINIKNPQFAVVGLSPDNGSVQTDVPGDITVTFNANPEATTVNSVSFVVERSGGDGTFGDGNEAPVLESVSVVDNQARMDLSGLIPSFGLQGVFEDTYRVTLRDLITDTNGNPLDGDGDTSPGGDFVAMFEMDLTTWSGDTAPVFQAKCDTCHTTLRLGGHNIATNYGDALKPANSLACVALNTNVATCALFRIQNGQMPQGAGCTGNPQTDADNGNLACLTQTEQNTIQEWIDDRLPE